MEGRRDKVAKIGVEGFPSKERGLTKTAPLHFAPDTLSLSSSSFFNYATYVHPSFSLVNLTIAALVGRLPGKRNVCV